MITAREDINIYKLSLFSKSKTTKLTVMETESSTNQTLIKPPQVRLTLLTEV